jgi:hypothetical protein
MGHWYRTHKPDRRKPVFLGGAAIGVLLVVAALAMIVIPSGAAGSTNKTLNCTTIDPQPVPATGASQTFTLHLCNDPTSPNQLGSAGITAPAGFVITHVTPPAGASWNPTTNVLTNLAIAPGLANAKDVTIQATTPSLCADPGNLRWAIDARQSNDFNGNPGNKFSPDPFYLPQSVTTASCKLVFVNQPVETARTTAVRTTKWGAIDSSNPGDPIKVDVEAGGVHYASPTGNVTIGVSGTNCGFAGDATTTVPFTNGYAIFSNLTMASVASGCQLTATSSAGYIASDASNSFNVDPVQLYFKTQPADAVVNTVVTDVKYGGTVPTGDPIQVGVEATDGTNFLPFNGSGTVSIGPGQATGGTGSCQLTSGSTTSASFSGGVASFSNLKMQNAPVTKCEFVATGSTPPGYDSATSGTFNVDQNGTICSGACDTGPIQSGDGNTTDVTANFTGTITVNFTPPNSLPQGAAAACGSAFTGSPVAQANLGEVILDPTSFSGVGPNATVIVNIAKQYLPKPPNQGNKFIPFCAGAHRLHLDLTQVDSPPFCDPVSNSDWTGLNGWTTQSYALATCVNDGFGNNFWGLVGNYTENPPIPAQDPQITQWVGNPDGSRTASVSLGTVQPGQNWYWDFHMVP